MATTETVASRKASLATHADATRHAVARVREYMAVTGLSAAALAANAGVGYSTIHKWLNGYYHNVSGDDSRFRGRVLGYLEANPVGAEEDDGIFGTVYETENVRLIRAKFAQMLVRPQAAIIYAPPGSQKTFVLKAERNRLNREELPRNGHGRRCYYVYSRQNITPSAIVRRVAEACGAHQTGTLDSVLRNIRLRNSGRRALLVLDEAQHLSIACLETVRELLDQPPHFSLILAGSHTLYNLFDQHASVLEQWNSRALEKVLLPGATREEAEAIVLREVGDRMERMSAVRRREAMAHIIDGATAKDAYRKGRTYVNIRTLTNSLLLMQQKAGKQ